jgi:predicted porin
METEMIKKDCVAHVVSCRFTLDRIVLVSLMTSLLLLPGAVRAQSSVTLYGIIDTGLQYLSGMSQGHLVSMESGDLVPSRWGMRGIEDLGGGTNVIFQLESGFSLTNGALACGIFCREAVIGVTNPAWGTFKVGRIGGYEIQNDSFYADPQRMNIFGVATLVRGRNWTYASNTLEYKTPTWGGLTIKGQYDLTNSTSFNKGNPGSGPGQLYGPQGRSDGIELTYQLGPAHFLAIYDEIRDANGQFDNVYQNSRSLMAGGTDDIGPVTMYGGYQHLSAPQASAEGYFVNAGATPTALKGGMGLPTVADQEWLGARWNVTPAAALMAAVYHTNANHGNGNANLWTLGGSYSLSKSTYLYAEVGLVTNSKTSNIGLDDGFSDPYGANRDDDPLSGPGNTRTNPNFGGSQVGVVAGVVTHF